MNEQLILSEENKGMILIDIPEFKQCETLLKFLNQKPQEKSIKINKFANNSKFLPIATIEMKLDMLFAGLWQTKNFRTHVIANEITGIIELSIYHPILKQWISREGCGAVQIQMRSKEQGGSGDITNVSDKIKNTLTKDFPHLKSECVKNAAKSFGTVFGRDLNRIMEDEYFPISDVLIKKISNENAEFLKQENDKKNGNDKK